MLEWVWHCRLRNGCKERFRRRSKSADATCKYYDTEDSIRLCWGHILTEYNVRNVDSCFETLDRIFNNNPKVIDAAKVGRGYDSVLKEIMMSLIMPIVDEFDQKKNNDTVYEARLQAAADNFTTDASDLPRASGCFPPCGFQAVGSVYNCMTCQYDSCQFPLDCPLQEINVEENNKTQMWCNVPFDLPSKIEIAWRYTPVKTTVRTKFNDVTSGTDILFSIPSPRPEHTGTYQCEIFTQERSLVRVYYYLEVIPRMVGMHSRLQDVFNQALLPAGRFPIVPPHQLSSLQQLPNPELLITCLTSMYFLLVLTLGVLFWWNWKRKYCPPEPIMLSEIHI